MELKEILLEQRVNDYCNRYYGMEENILKLDEALKSQGLLPEKLITLEDLQKVKELEMVKTKRAAPKRAQTSAAIKINIEAPTIQPEMDDDNQNEENKESLIDRSNEPHFTKAEKQILSGGFTKVLNASVFNQKTLQREI